MPSEQLRAQELDFRPTECDSSNRRTGSWLASRRESRRGQIARQRQYFHAGQAVLRADSTQSDRLDASRERCSFRQSDRQSGTRRSGLERHGQREHKRVTAAGANQR